MNVLIISGTAFLGAIVSALLGWLDSGEPFDGRKFGASITFGLITAVGFAVVYSYTAKIEALDIAKAFIGGAGVDVLTNRAIGYAVNKRK